MNAAKTEYSCAQGRLHEFEDDPQFTLAPKIKLFWSALKIIFQKVESNYDVPYPNIGTPTKLGIPC